MEDTEPWIIDIGFILLFISFTTVGALIASRIPSNPIGWIFCGLGLSGTLTSLCGEYAVYALTTRPGSLPQGDIAAWFSGWLSGSNIVTLIVLLFLLFPNGLLLSPRWSAVAWLTLIANVLSLAQYLRPGSFDGFSPFSIANPFGIKDADTTLSMVATIGFGLALVTAIASVSSLVLRFRRAQGVERQQIKWLAFAGSAVGATFLVGPILWSIPELPETVWSALFLFSVSSIPISVGIAILKYRLYDIDIIINRALVYGTLIVIVTGLYIILVGIVGVLFQSAGNSFLVILATGLIAVLFQPLRDRLQRGVNRLMYGERDDPYAVLSRLSRRLEATLAPSPYCPRSWRPSKNRSNYLTPPSLSGRARRSPSPPHLEHLLPTHYVCRWFIRTRRLASCSLRRARPARPSRLPTAICWRILPARPASPSTPPA